MQELMVMSQKEIQRLGILNKVQDGYMTQVKAAEFLGISERHVRNLLTQIKAKGTQGLISKKRGQPGNHKISQEIRQKTLRLIQEKYSDFGPTLAAEKLCEHHLITVSRETLRKWMTQIHLWVPRTKKRKIHQLRMPKEQFGEMSQVDTSHHDWFENNNPCGLLISIDDATSAIVAARFETSESLNGYYQLLQQQIEEFGRPLSMYSDRFAVFETSLKKENLTQFRRSLQTLDIQWIGANSPQAKGRVERCNRTLQDRLVKEMRLKGVKTIEEGNLFLPEFIKQYNKTFSKEPKKKGDLHRSLESGVDLSRTLSKYEERTLTKDLLFQFNNKHYDIVGSRNNCFPGQKIEIRINRDGALRFFIGEKEVIAKRLDQIYEEPKKVERTWPEKRSSKPRVDHPWRKFRKKQKKARRRYNRW
jgi:hypothetical protein